MSDSLNPEFRRRRTLNKLDSVTIQPLLNCNDKLADLQALCYHDMKSQGTNGHKSDDSFKVHLSGNSYEVYVILNRRTSSTPQSSALKTTKFSLPEVEESGTPRLRPCKALDRRVLDVRGARVTQQGHNLGAPDRVVPYHRR